MAVRACDDTPEERVLRGLWARLTFLRLRHRHIVGRVPLHIGLGHYALIQLARKLRTEEAQVAAKIEQLEDRPTGSMQRPLTGSVYEPRTLIVTTVSP